MREFISTLSGRKIFLDASPEEISGEICIGDIAAGLSKICRFNGQIVEFYSVAEHSVRVAMLMPEEHRLYGLLHDAAEAYIGDIVSPVKRMLRHSGNKAFDDLEERIMEAIFIKFRVVKGGEPAATMCKLADNRLLATEVRDLQPASSEKWEILEGIEPLSEELIPWSPREASKAFMDAFRCFSELSEKTLAA